MKIINLILIFTLVFSIFVIADNGPSNNNQEKSPTIDAPKQSLQQNRVKETVHSLLKINNSKIGPRIAEIAIEFNNSERRLIQEQEKIEKRSTFMKFLFGNDKEVLNNMEQIANQNQERVQKLKQFLNETNEETRLQLNNQIQKLEQEQQRLREELTEERNKGIFSFLIN